MTLFIYLFVSWQLQNLILKMHSETKVKSSDIYNYTIYLPDILLFFQKTRLQVNKLKK